MTEKAVYVIGHNLVYRHDTKQMLENMYRPRGRERPGAHAKGRGGD